MKKLILAIITLILSYYPVYANSFSSVEGLEVETKIMYMIKESNIIASSKTEKDLEVQLQFWAEKMVKYFIVEHGYMLKRSSFIV